MAFRIGDFVLRGELRNTRTNGVYGWIEFAPDYGIHIELTGNLKGKLRGKHIKFSSPRGLTAEHIDPASLPQTIHDLADRQIGVVGNMQLQRVKVPTISLIEFQALDLTEQEKFLRETDSLYLEWFSQNGHVIAEVADPTLEYFDERQSLEGNTPEFDAHDDSRYDIGITEVFLDDTGQIRRDDPELEGDADNEDDDPYGLFNADLQRSVNNALGAEPEDAFADHNSNPDLAGTGRNWDDVPGIDPETKAMYEQWDEIFEGKKDEPVAYLFETPLKLPPPEKVTSDSQAEPLVTAILAQLALLSVAVDVCEHYTPLETYHLLMTEILPTAKVHPNLAASKMVQHYSTSDFCASCEAEFEEEYEMPDDDDDDDDESE